MPPHIPFDWKNPDYDSVYRWRIDRVRWLRDNPGKVEALKGYYRDHIAQFIIDWGSTFDPRNIERGLPANIPFILFPKQEEWVDWFVGLWRNQRPGLTEKTRDMGMSWLTVATAASVCLLYDGVVAGFGSRKEEYVDKIGAPKSLFWKAREYIKGLPKEFRGEWDERKHAPHMRIIFPDTGSAMTGESGDGIGRGDRCSFYFVDESAFLERPQLTDASLSATTNCRQDISTPNGRANPFAEKRFGGKIPVFTFHWRDDPRKDEAWYNKQCEELDPVTVAQEIDIDYSASVEGVLIPSAWVQDAIDAHVKLGIEPTGTRFGALDVADEGADLNAFAGRHGFMVEHLESWSGKGGDIFQTVVKSFWICDTNDYERFLYDADGLGSGVRGDARVIGEQRRAEGNSHEVTSVPFRGSGEVYDPDGEMVPKRKNKDFFSNLKAQSWWALRLRFQETHRAVNGAQCDPDKIISIPSGLKERDKLVSELSQPTYSLNTAGKVVVDKKPDGAKSPNLGDAVMILFSPAGVALDIWKRLAE